TPRHWDIAFVRRFMLTFGLVSSFFDFVTFGFLIFVTHATAQTFQTAWFVESLITELAIVLVVRTRKTFWQSRPSALLVWLTAGTFIVAVATPVLPYAAWFGFVPLPLPTLAGLLTITIMYLFASEATKHWFFSDKHSHSATKRAKIGIAHHRV
ncbi:MAG: cation transporting ATPase C-terminal domain-containing protein, partial [Phyllobacterium sp.]|uniref:cation transporting ATPase C-terminal domain-containing protein n=1 Tax=Phyllobacterium sp. TaxID=1871046 RepID=UPI0030F09BEF